LENENASVGIVMKISSHIGKPVHTVKQFRIKKSTNDLKNNKKHTQQKQKQRKKILQKLQRKNNKIKRPGSFNFPGLFILYKLCKFLLNTFP